MQSSTIHPAEDKKPSVDFSAIKDKLNTIQRTFKASASFEEAMIESEKAVLSLFDAESLRVYRAQKQKLVTWVKRRNDAKEIQFPLSSSSLAGFSALSHKVLRVNDVKNYRVLAAYHPELKFNIKYDVFSGVRTRSVISAPLDHEDTLVGVLQIINCRDKDGFGEQCELIAKSVAQIVAKKLSEELKTTTGPFEDLILRGLLTRDQLAELQDRAKAERTFVSYLMRTELGILSIDIGASLEKHYQVPFHKYDSVIRIPEDLVKGISKYYLKENLWVPIDGSKDRTVVVMDNPKDLRKIQDIQNVIRAHSYEFMVGLPEDILNYLGMGPPLPDTDTLADAMAQRLSELEIRTKDEDAAPADQLKETYSIDVDSDSTAVLYMNNLILQAQRMNASDIHIEPYKPGRPAVVRVRVDGICRRIAEIPSKSVQAVISRIKIMSDLDIADRRLPQDGKARVNLKGRPLELRIATVPTVYGESVVIRLLAMGGGLPLGKLNLSARNESEIKRLCARPHGIFLVVGPTGSGKTTTLHGILGHINKPERKIWTAEDPVEITQAGLQQVQVSRKIGLDFARVMRAFLRADPDVILIGEMRDYETANIGIESSLTGHLVFSTLHTNSAPETITRLIELGIDPLDFSDALLGILAQRLVRTLCPDCKEPYHASKKESQRILEAYGAEHADELTVDPNQIMLHTAKGCEKCGNTGYRGRTGIHELLVNSDAIKQIIARKGLVEEIRKEAVREGMRTLMQDGLSKIVKGDTDMVQLHHVAAE
ncbi:MAG TPA: GspE/PulE family protein [Deltaproteobacteria bacterium]|nr:GspE/PulE family protein [Deltaproteobacteria bacterium]